MVGNFGHLLGSKNPADPQRATRSNPKGINVSQPFVKEDLSHQDAGGFLAVPESRSFQAPFFWNRCGGIANGAWYAVQVKQHNERRGECQLTLRGIPVLLPLIEVIRRYRTRRVAYLEPLFPGYLFANVEPTESNPQMWQTLRWTPGVKRILGSGDVPIPLADAVIDAIRERTRELGFVRPELQHVSGSKVRIRGGPLAGLEAIFDCSMSRSGRVRVLLELLGQQARVEVDAVDLEVV